MASDETAQQWWALDDPNLPAHLAHLAPDAPSAKCSGCGRSTWDLGEFDELCRMPQPDGSRCTGRFFKPPAVPGQAGDLSAAPDPDLAEAERNLRRAATERVGRGSIERVMAEYDRRGAELARSRSIVEAATALVEQWDEENGFCCSKHVDITMCALAAAVRSDQPGEEGEQR